MFKVIITNPATKRSPWVKDDFKTYEEAYAWAEWNKGRAFRTEQDQFTIQIINLSLDEAWVEKNIQEKRKREYPSTEEVVEALVEYFIEDRPEKLEEIQAKREAIKTKYPKLKKN